MSERFDAFAKAREITKPALPKRFYKDVSIRLENGLYHVELDGRSVKTPGGRAVAVPSAALAALLRDEWDGQGEHIDASTMPLTRLCNSAIEMVMVEPGRVIDELAAFSEHDLVCYRADHPEGLVALQSREWDDVVERMQAKLGRRLNVTTGILSVGQPADIPVTLRERLEALDAFRLTALHSMATLATSISIALLVLEGDISPQDGWRKAHVDEDWNIAQWGEDYEAAQRRQGRWREFEACAKLISAMGTSA